VGNFFPFRRTVLAAGLVLLRDRRTNQRRIPTTIYLARRGIGLFPLRAAARNGRA